MLIYLVVVQDMLVGSAPSYGALGGQFLPWGCLVRVTWATGVPSAQPAN